MGLPQPRLPAPALQAGPATAGCQPELKSQTPKRREGLGHEGVGSVEWKRGGLPTWSWCQPALPQLKACGGSPKSHRGICAASLDPPAPPHPVPLRSGPQSRSLLPAMGLCHFFTLALVLLVLLEALAQADTQKMVGAQCGVRPRACYSLRFLLVPAPPLSYCLRSPQKQHQVCGDRQLKAGSTNCPSEKCTARARYSHRMDSLQKQDLRRPKIHRAARGAPYQPPTLASLQRLLLVHQSAMLNHINEVWPRLFLGDAYVARDKSKLTQLGITHVVNAAAGKFQVDTGAKFYHGMSLEYYGIEADDNPFFDLSVYFLPVARYIRAALSLPQGRVLVHCAMGVSRSATLVLAFLMIYENMTLVEAIQTVQAHRNICPNSGFLRQLQVLDNRLGQETGRL
nr:dual specificity protein phosphatase 13 isoform X3 [Aotus nancymaae]